MRRFAKDYRVFYVEEAQRGDVGERPRMEVERPGNRLTRVVPACAQDAARLAARERPDVRTVTIGSRTVPYWDAGAAYRPYSRGNFPADVDVREGTLAIDVSAGSETFSDSAFVTSDATA